MNAIIAGIQQVGIGVADLPEAWSWYRKHFGMDIRLFEDSAEAAFMTRYTGNAVHARKAVLALNMRGGGGFEIWQYTSRTPQAADSEVLSGDFGVNAIVLRSTDVAQLYESHSEAKLRLSGSPLRDPGGSPTYFVHDPNGNLFQIVESKEFFSRSRHICGGVAGVSIGVRDIDKARKLYSNVLGYSDVVYDEEGEFEDMAAVPGGAQRLRRVLLRHSKPGLGTFGRFFGATTVELICSPDRTPQKIYEGRYWGDCGFIHVCFDVQNMDALKQSSEENGFPFTVDSGSSFDMGDAKGRFAYTEDPDGTLIEMVETFKLPIFAKLKWNLDISNRAPEKPLANWLLKALRFSRVK